MTAWPPLEITVSMDIFPHGADGSVIRYITRGRSAIEEFANMSWWKRLWGGRAAVAPVSTQDVRSIVDRRVPFLRRLPLADRPALISLVQTFLQEKEYWGTEGVTVTTEMKVVVAAYACLLVLKRPDLGLFPRTREIILYPSEFGERVEAIGPDGRRYQINETKIGETWHRGPVLLAWDRVGGLFSVDDDGHNTVLHEFAHALDFMDGLADGAPPLVSAESYAEWKRVMSEGYEMLATAVRRGRRTFIDPYGAKNPAEFFAVVTEQFFEQPRRFLKNHRRLYAVLKAFYRQDPASWPR